MDDLDRAAEIEQQTREQAINAAKSRGIESELPDDDEHGNRFCLDCGIQIPEARLRVRPESVRCVDCKSMKEYRGKR